MPTVTIRARPLDGSTSASELGCLAEHRGHHEQAAPEQPATANLETGRHAGISHARSFCPGCNYVSRNASVHELDGRGIEASSQQLTGASHSDLVLHEQASGGPALPDEDPVAQDTATAIFQAIEDAQRP